LLALTRNIVHQWSFFVSISACALVRRHEEALPRQTLFGWFKRPADFLLAVIGLTLGAPLITTAAVLVKLTSRGPVFYSQVRLGLDGRPFRIYKIRSMRQDSEAKTGPCWSVKGDPRVTPVGRFLRWSHIDELPQMWNILVGDMSLIGPRPERPEMVPGLEQALPGYRRRLLVRPGLTGLAQVLLPPDTDLNSVRIKLAHDLCYLKRYSFGLDCRIFVATFFHIFGVSAATTALMCYLPNVAVTEVAGEVDKVKPGVLVPDLQAV
jgi:lipopolysaccharide/colanic/teichoic acid biosynthesis glycosyltransferase